MLLLSPCLALLAWWAPTARGWAAPQLHAPAHTSLQARRCVQPRAELLTPDVSDDDKTLEMRVRRSDLDAAAAGAATGAEISDDDKTEGIPNYLLRFSGTVVRLAEAPDGASAVPDDGMVYELGRTVRILTSDVIEMVQQQGGAAEQVDYLGENLLVENMLFDDFAAGELLAIKPPDAAGDTPKPGPKPGPNPGLKPGLSPGPGLAPTLTQILALAMALAWVWA